MGMKRKLKYHEGEMEEGQVGHKGTREEKEKVEERKNGYSKGQRGEGEAKKRSVRIFF